MDIELLSNGDDSSTQAQLIEYEKYLLAVAIHSPNACFEILSKLDVIDFSTEPNQLIYGAIQELSNEGQIISPVTLIEKLKSKKHLERVGNAVYITDISKKFMTDEGFEAYVAIIFRYSLSRRLEHAIDEIKILKNSSTESIYDLVLKAQEKILNIKTDISKDDAEHLSSIVGRVVELALERAEVNTNLTGVPTNLIDIDNLTGGWQKGDFVILAARPSMGKTAFALNLATNAASQKSNVAIFSLEMPKEQLVQRILSSEAFVDSKKIRTGQGLNESDISQLKHTSEIVKNYNIVIDDTPGLNVLQLQNKIRKMQRDMQIDICFIDYLQLLSGIPNKNENRQNEVSTISRQIKKIARELNIPIICLSQLSRSVEQREDKKPLMSDLRDSGAIEQDADIIMFLYRPEYYTKSADDEGRAELIFSKHRNGSTGSVELNFSKDFGRFSSKKM